jgi:hypothetical protein
MIKTIFILILLFYFVQIIVAVIDLVFSSEDREYSFIKKKKDILIFIIPSAMYIILFIFIIKRIVTIWRILE